MLAPEEGGPKMPEKATKKRTGVTPSSSEESMEQQFPLGTRVSAPYDGDYYDAVVVKVWRHIIYRMESCVVSYTGWNRVSCVV